MENKLQRVNTKALSLEVKNIGIELFHYNQLTAFPISDAQIIDWSKSIMELAPDLNTDILKEILDGMKVGRIEFDHRLGIQNIFNAYKEYLNDEIRGVRRLINDDFYGVENKPEGETSKMAREKLKELISKFNNIFGKPQPPYIPDAN